MTTKGYLSQVRNRGKGFICDNMCIKSIIKFQIAVTDGWPHGPVHGLQLLVVHRDHLLAHIQTGQECPSLISVYYIGAKSQLGQICNCVGAFTSQLGQNVSKLILYKV